jgi:uncharacterized protein
MGNILELNSHCRRVLGVLLEKEQTTPDYYPLTLNALIAACNQTTNRNPVMNLKRYEVLDAIHALGRIGLVSREAGPRADRWRHMLIQAVPSRPPHKALLTVLMLRGAQTPGELKARTERMHPFDSLEAVDAALKTLSETDPPLVRELPRRPGQKESRWSLNIELEEGVEAVAEPVPEATGYREGPAATLERLEKKVEELERRVSELEERSGHSEVRAVAPQPPNH